MPEPGGRVRALAERLEDRAPVRLGDARAVVLDDQLERRRRAAPRAPRSALPAGVCLIALTSRFSTIRSIIAASASHRDRRDIQRQAMLGDEVGSPTISRTSAPTSTGWKVRLGDAALQPVQVEEVRDHPVDPPGVLCDPVREVARLGRCSSGRRAPA